MKLTLSEKKFVEDNHNLIYKFCNTNKINISDFYDVLAISLCKCAQAYNSEKSNVSTFVINCMKNAYITEIRKENRNNENMFLHQDINELGKTSEIFNTNEIVNLIEIKDFISSLSPFEKEFITFIDEGYTQQEISNMFYRDRNWVIKKRKLIRNKWQTYKNKL